ncbi:MAG: PatB family C-S lyase [Coprobacter sp.]|nr:PatB family C-S lyase [Coprobacter sp.]
MGMYDFDKIITRRDTGALKVDALQERYGDADLLPLWVADMDFATPDFILAAIKERLEHPVLGYTVDPVDYWPSVIRWQASHHQWDIRQEWLTFVPGVVKGIGLAINYFTRPGEKIIIQSPVYHIFRQVIEGNNRVVADNPLRENPDGTYSMDFDQLARIADEHCKIFLLSNPHNPAGIVWDRETLARLARFCRERRIIVLSDEIHADMTLWDNHHVPFATVSPEAAECCITLCAPSKVFNIPGIVSAYAVVSDEKLRTGFYGWLQANELNEPAVFSPIATIAAYEQGESWRKQMLEYVQKNIDFIIDFCAEYIPEIKPLRPQASFLVWLDCRELHLTHAQLVDLFVKKARLALNDGEMFGKGGAGFMRMNVAAPRDIVRQALEQLRTALNKTE